jgi:hypothetical protein
MRFMFIGALLLGAHKSWESLRFCVATHLRRGQNIRVRACSWKPVSVMCRCVSFAIIVNLPCKFIDSYIDDIALESQHMTFRSVSIYPKSIAL